MNLRMATVLLSLTLVAICLASREASATLGEKADSIAKDRKALSAAKGATTTHSKYTVQEASSEATTVREYLTPSGVVFAVAWNGMVHPDLATLLGKYWPEYIAAREQMPRRHGQRRSRVRGDQVVVETGGHMRDLQGRAYVPTLVPEGVDIHEIK